MLWLRKIDDKAERDCVIMYQTSFLLIIMGVLSLIMRTSFNPGFWKKERNFIRYQVNIFMLTRCFSRNNLFNVSLYCWYVCVLFITIVRFLTKFLITLTNKLKVWQDYIYWLAYNCRNNDINWLIYSWMKFFGSLCRPSNACNGKFSKVDADATNM